MDSVIVKKTKARKSIPENIKIILHTEVDGLCPMCNKPLMDISNTKLKKFEIAHIYPLNPRAEEEELLKGIVRLSEDPDDMKNLIALCKDCHNCFDNPRTIEGYNEMLKLKLNLLQKDQNRIFIFNNPIEKDIVKVLKMLVEQEFEDGSGNDLEYDAKRVDSILDSTIKPLTKRKIKENVEMYYSVIREEFKRLDFHKKNSFEIIASQVKTSYLKLSQKTNNQEEIYNNLVKWMYKITNEYSYDASKIIVCFFIQNCEVF
nr:ABC-three component system protein [Clostridioides sp.]